MRAVLELQHLSTVFAHFPFWLCVFQHAACRFMLLLFCCYALINY